MMENKPLAVDTGRGFSINYRGKSLYSRYNPSATPEKIAASISMEEETLYIIPSPLLLYGISSLINILPESSFLLGIEIDQSLMALSLEPASQFDTSQFQLIRLDKREQLKAMIDKLGIWNYRRCRLIALNNGYNLYREQYDYLFNFASFALSTFWRNRLTINKLGSLWIRNIIENSSLIQRDLPDNEGKPVVICGAGPSLDSTIELIRNHREAIYLMAVDTALPTLLDADTVPDLVFALESQFYNQGDFHNSRQYSFNLLADITSYPPICRMNRGELFFSFTDFHPNRLTERMMKAGLLNLKLPPLGSVGVAALSAALQLFESEIYLTGLDFAYTPGKSHSKGSPFIKTTLENTDRMHSVDNLASNTGRRLIELPGKRENTFITTDSVLQTYASLMTDILKNETRVFDLSTEGYPLGIPYVSPEEFKPESHRNPLKRIENKKTLFTVNNMGFLEREIEYLEKLIQLWENFNQSDLTDIPEELMSALSEVDYVFIDFPDRLPHPRKEIGFITRAVKSARNYLALINRIINREN